MRGWQGTFGGWVRGFLAAATILLTPSIGLAAEKVRFETDWVITGKVAPFFMGIAKGFYKDAGLEVTIFRGHGSAQGVKDVFSGTTDYGFVDSIAGIVGISQGNPVQYVSMVFDQAPHIVVSLGKANIQTPRDLKGKTLAAPVGDTGRYIVATLLTANGMRPDDVTWLTTTPAGKNPAILSGKVDAAPHFTTGLPPLVLKAKENNLTLNVLHASQWGVDIYSLGILAHHKTIQDKPDPVRRWVHAATKAWAWSIEHPEEMLALFKHYAPEVETDLARQEFKEAVKLVLTDFTKKHGIGVVDPAKMRKTVEFVTTHLKLSRQVRAEDVYTNEFLPRP